MPRFFPPDRIGEVIGMMGSSYVDELREAIRLQRDDCRALSVGVARRRAERRAAERVDRVPGTRMPVFR